MEKRKVNCCWCNEVVLVPADVMTTGEIYCKKCFEGIMKSDDNILSRRLKRLGVVNAEVSAM